MNSNLRQNIRTAFVALRRNRLRTSLSLLGMAIGIMSIVIIMSAGKSLRLVLLSQLDAFGSNTITVEIKIPNTSANSSENASGMAQGISVTTLKEKDMKGIDKIPGVKTSYGAVMGQAIATSAYDEKRTNYFAVSSEFKDIDTGAIEKGRFYTSEDEQGLGKYAVLGATIAEKLFPNQNPIGQQIKMQKTNVTVIGVFEKRGSTGFLDMDQMIFIPLKTAQAFLLGFDHLSFIMVQMSQPERSAAIVADMQELLRNNHDITDPKKDDFSVTTQEESKAIIGTILSGLTLVLTIIAAVALIVGGVGIMNIMYVAVNERVFEIGLRKSFGAQQKTIRSQFLIESIVITLLGGFFGILMALGMTFLMYIGANYAGFAWPFAFSFEALILSLVFSSTVGISFGYFPAKKASELNPIQALNRTVS
jgi:putative ABC transport system permease protein